MTRPKVNMPAFRRAQQQIAEQRASERARQSARAVCSECATATPEPDSSMCRACAAKEELALTGTVDLRPAPAPLSAGGSPDLVPGIGPVRPARRIAPTAESGAESMNAGKHTSGVHRER